MSEPVALKPGGWPEPPTGSVVKLIWPSGGQEVWVSATESLGSWYYSGHGYLNWSELGHRARRAEGVLHLMADADHTAFALGWEMGRAQLLSDFTRALEDLATQGPVPQSATEAQAP